MEDLNVNILADEIEKIYKDIVKTSSQAYLLRKQNKRGESQACMIRLKYLHRKLIGLRSKLKDLIQGNICEIQYQFYDKNKDLIEQNAILTNVTDKQINDILELYCKVEGFKFNKIIEIKRSKTKLG